MVLTSLLPYPAAMPMATTGTITIPAHAGQAGRDAAIMQVTITPRARVTMPATTTPALLAKSRS